MRFYQQFRRFAGRSAVIAGTGLLFVCGPALSASGQPPQTPPPAQTTQASGTTQAREIPTPPAPPAVENGMAISIEDAVKMALENNLGIKAARMNPEMQEYALEQIEANYAPAVISSFSHSSSAAPPTEFLSSGVAVVTNGNFLTTAGVQQFVRFGGGNYSVTWNGSRGTTDAPRAVFNPQLGSGLTAVFNQPLLQNFRIDTTREQLLQQRNQQTISDIQLRQSITQTSYAVRSAYYNLIGAIAGYQVAQQSLLVSQQSLHDNERRLQVGTIPQIDLVSSQAEVAGNEELVVVQEGAIESAEDLLRSLIMNPSQQGFWNVTFKPTDPEQVAAQAIDDAAIQAAVKNALENRTDIRVFKKQMENTDLSKRLASNQKLPALNLRANYGVTGIGGTQFTYDQTGLSSSPTGSSVRSFADALRDVLGNDFRTWSVALNFSYPIGQSPAEAAYAQAKILGQQQQTSLANLETQVTTSIREAARQVNTNLKRVEVDRRARELSQQKYDAELKRFDVGLSTTFELFQAERDLAQARRTEVTAQIDYSRSLAAFEAIQLSPLNGQ